MTMAEFRQLKEERNRLRDDYLNNSIEQSKDSIMNISVRRKEGRYTRKSLAESKGVDPHSEEGVAINTSADYVN